MTLRDAFRAANESVQPTEQLVVETVEKMNAAEPARKKTAAYLPFIRVAAVGVCCVAIAVAAAVLHPSDPELPVDPPSAEVTTTQQTATELTTVGTTTASAPATDDTTVPMSSLTDAPALTTTGDNAALTTTAFLTTENLAQTGTTAAVSDETIPSVSVSTTTSPNITPVYTTTPPATTTTPAYTYTTTTPVYTTTSPATTTTPAYTYTTTTPVYTTTPPATTTTPAYTYTTTTPVYTTTEPTTTTTPEYTYTTTTPVYTTTYYTTTTTTSYTTTYTTITTTLTTIPSEDVPLDYVTIGAVVAPIYEVGYVTAPTGSAPDGGDLTLSEAELYYGIGFFDVLGGLSCNQDSISTYEGVLTYGNMSDYTDGSVPGISLSVYTDASPPENAVSFMLYEYVGIDDIEVALAAYYPDGTDADDPHLCATIRYFNGTEIQLYAKGVTLETFETIITELIYN